MMATHRVRGIEVFSAVPGTESFALSLLHANYVAESLRVVSSGEQILLAGLSWPPLSGESPGVAQHEDAG